MSKWRGIITFETDPSYAAPSGVERPRSAGWSFAAWYDAANAPAALVKLQTTRDNLLAVMHEAYHASAASVSDAAVYRDILRENYSPGTYKGGRTSAGGHFPAEPEWCGIITLLPLTPGGQGRHFIHGLARATVGGGPILINQVEWNDTNADIVALAADLEANTELRRKNATAHFAAGFFVYTAYVVGELDVRKTGRPFDSSPRRLRRRDRDTHPDSP